MNNDYIKNSTFLVTGGAGFIGSHITQRLLNEGAKVVVLDNFFTGTMDNLKSASSGSGMHKNLEIIKEDIRNLEPLTDIIRTRKIDYISHQAALRSVPKSVEDPLLYHEVDVTGTMNVLLAAYKNKVKRVVFASSSSVYGERDKFPERESDMPAPISPYASCKLAGESYCSLFTKCYGLETVSLRYFNVFGPRQSLENKYAVVIPKFIVSLLDNEPMPIYGDGTQARDFTYIDNVVGANFVAFSSTGGIGEVFNVGCGNSTSVIDLSKALQRLMKINIEPKFLSERPGDVDKTLADITKGRKLLGYTPKVGFEEGLIQTIDYFRDNKPS